MNKSYDEVVGMLINDYRFSSEWIDIASKIIADFGYTVEDLSHFDSLQLGIIYKAIQTYGESVADPDPNFVNRIIDSRFNSTQMQLLLMARQEGFWQDELYRLMDPVISYSKLNYLIQALIEGFDIAKEYDIYKLDAGQIYELYAAYKSKVDVSKYFSPDHTEMNDTAMSIMRHAGELKLDAEYNSDSNTITIKL